MFVHARYRRFSDVRELRSFPPRPEYVPFLPEIDFAAFCLLRCLPAAVLSRFLRLVRFGPVRFDFVRFGATPDSLRWLCFCANLYPPPLVLFLCWWHRADRTAPRRTAPHRTAPNRWTDGPACLVRCPPVCWLALAVVLVLVFADCYCGVGNKYLC